MLPSNLGISKSSFVSSEKEYLTGIVNFACLIEVSWMNSLNKDSKSEFSVKASKINFLVF